MTSSNQMSNHLSSFSGVEPIITQVFEAQGSDAESGVQHNGASSSNVAEVSLSREIKLPYQATHQVELLHLHAEIESLLQQVRILKQQRLSECDTECDNLDLSDRPALAIR